MLPIGGKVLLLILIGITVLAFGRRASFLVRLLKLGRQEDRSGNFGQRMGYTLGQVLTERCTLKNVSKGDYAGIGHMLLFYGFSLFVISYVFHIAEGFYERLSPAVFGVVFNNVFYLFLDIAGLVVIATIVWATIRRYITKPDRLEPTLEAGVILIVVFCLMILNYAVEGFRLLAEEKPFSDWSFVGLTFSHLFRNMEWKGSAYLLFWVFWWLHLLVVFGFSIYILYSKHLHILASHFNLFYHSTRPKGALPVIEDFEKADGFGVSKITDFSWKQLLDLYACTECGRCTVNCPANLTGKPLRPGDMVHNLKLHLLRSGKDLLKEKTTGDRGEGVGKAADIEQAPIVSQVVTEDELWACTTCHACVDVCPVDIEHVARIVHLRRHLTMAESKFPSEVKSVFRNLETYGDTHGRGVSLRMDWAGQLPVKSLNEAPKADVLYWVGCEASFNDRNREVSKALVVTLQKAGVNVGVLGKDERCCGDPARRIGNEYLFENLACRNIEVLNRHGVKKIVTYCPHCFNTLKNEYPQFGGQFEVIHYTQYLSELLKQRKLRIERPMEEKITFQDPCYLGRVNEIYGAPREIIRSIPGLALREMNRSGEKGFCCGGGGGRMWMHESIGQRINQVRSAEATKTGIDLIATACPYCLSMFEDGIRNIEKEKEINVLDLAEIVYRCV